MCIYIYTVTEIQLKRESPFVDKLRASCEITMCLKARQEGVSLIKMNYNEQNCRVSSAKHG